MFAATRGGVLPTNPINTAYVGSRSGTTSVSLSTLSLAQNDLVVLITGWGRSDGTPGPTTSGYTQAALLSSNTGGGDSELYVGYKFMGSTPDTVVDVTPSPWNSAATNTIAYVWRGINTSTPLAGTTTTATGALTPVVAPAISYTGSAIVVMTTIVDSGLTYTAPSGLSKFVQQAVTPGGGASSIAVGAVYDNAYYPSVQFSGSSSYVWCAATIALTYP